MFETTTDVFEVHRCASCAMLFLSPQPGIEDLAAFYPKEYWFGPHDESGHQSLLSRMTEFYRRVVLLDHKRFVHRALREQGQQPGPNRLLDVGCGDGFFLGECGHDDVCGMDISADAAKAARARGLDVRHGTLDDPPFEAGEFAVVTTFHMLEHVVSAQDTLQAAHRMLRPGGDLIIQVPNADSWQAKLLGRHWAGLDVPRHLANYTPTTLCRELERAGFEIIRTSHFSLRDNPTALANSLAPRLYPPARMTRSGRSASGPGAWLSDLAYLALTTAVTPFTLVESVFGHGGAIMVQARAS